jgi:hypothetical protein
MRKWGSRLLGIANPGGQHDWKAARNPLKSGHFHETHNADRCIVSVRAKSEKLLARGSVYDTKVYVLGPTLLSQSYKTRAKVEGRHREVRSQLESLSGIIQAVGAMS